jgi:hypothetical protein
MSPLVTTAGDAVELRTLRCYEKREFRRDDA